MTRVATQSPPFLFTVRAACEALGMKRTKFYEKVKAGHFHILKDDGASVVTAEEVYAYVAKVKAGQMTQPAGA